MGQHSFMLNDMSPHRSANRAERLLLILSLLGERPHTARELQGPTGASLRTLERDLAELLDLEKIERISHGQYSLPVGVGSGLNEAEGLSVYIALRMLHHAGTDNPHQRRTLGKLLGLLPAHLQDDARRILRTPLSQNGQEERTFELIARALSTREVLRYDYTDAKGQVSRRRMAVFRVEVSPENLALYVVGEDLGKRERRVMKLTRMTNVQLEAEQAPPPPPIQTEATPWGVSALAGGPTLQVKLRFTDEARRRLLERPHPAVHIRTEPDANGWWPTEITVSRNNPDEILPMLLGWSTKVIVDEPAALRDAWLQRIRALAEHARLHST